MYWKYNYANVDIWKHFVSGGYLINMQLISLLFAVENIPFPQSFYLSAFALKLNLLSLHLDIKDDGRGAAIFVCYFSTDFLKVSIV